MCKFDKGLNLFIFLLTIQTGLKMTKLISDNIILRPLEINDASVLAGMANNINIWNNVRDFMPYPYTLQDAWNFIAMCETEDMVTTFGIEYKGNLAGVIGLSLQGDIYKHAAELGYWIGEDYWNLGIASSAVGLIVQYGFEKLNRIRIYSGVFAHNKASQKVLEKNGFILEAIFKKGYIKNGVIGNEYKYALVRE
jgi:[ribosomal protein S5]-alanine N-acetyltransferase